MSTGDASTMGGYLLLGATSLLGALGLIKKRNKK
ncbi:MAG: LPXTG cell wall anchor domain-containing protein [Clostridium sp.]